jgi:hypothetical protein
MSPEAREKISKAGIGRKKTPIQIEKLRLLNKGKKLSEETCRKLSESHKGHRNSAESYAKMAAKLRGRKYPASFGAKVSASKKGIPPTEKVLDICRVKIQCVENGIIYKSIRDAGRSIGTKEYTHITRAAKTGQRCAGYHWRYLRADYSPEQ